MQFPTWVLVSDCLGGCFRGHSLQEVRVWTLLGLFLDREGSFRAVFLEPGKATVGTSSWFLVGNREDSSVTVLFFLKQSFGGCPTGSVSRVNQRG